MCVLFIVKTCFFVVPGYVGCFPNSNTDTTVMNENMTIQMCIVICREPPHETRYAVLRAGNSCRCQGGLFSSSNRVEDSECNIPCAGDPYDICGGPRTSGFQPRDRISVYEGGYIKVTFVLTGYKHTLKDLG